MARKVQVILSDDLDENLSADETVSFSLDGTSYEIDLADKNAKEMRDVFSRYVSAARKVGRGTPRLRVAAGPRPPPVAAWTASRPAPSATGPARTVTRSATAAASRPASSRPTRPRTDRPRPARTRRTADVRVTSARVIARRPARFPVRGAGPSSSRAGAARRGGRPGRRPSSTCADARRGCTARRSGPAGARPLTA